MRIHLGILVCCGVLGVVFIGSRQFAGFDTPEQLTVYSIDGRDFEPGQEPMTEEKFHGYPVLGKITVEDANTRKALFAAVQKGMTQSDGIMMKCFWPRHAIRTVENGRTIDYVICFQCRQLEIHAGDSRSVKPITHEPQEILNQYLRQTGVPLAPGMSGEDEQSGK